MLQKLFLLTLVVCSLKTYACLDIQQVQNFLLQIAKDEAQIADIPEYKQSMLLDKPDHYGITTNKINLINIYKSSHLKKPLSEIQVAQINALEAKKQEFIKAQERCN